MLMCNEWLKVFDLTYASDFVVHMQTLLNDQCKFELHSEPQFTWNEKTYETDFKVNTVTRERMLDFI